MSARATAVLGMAVRRPGPGEPVPPVVEGLVFCHAPGGANADPDALAAAESVASMLQEGSSDGILEGWPPEDRYLHLWHICLWLDTSPRPGGPGGSFDWRALPPCPLRQRQFMMSFVAAVRSGGLVRERRPEWPSLP